MPYLTNDQAIIFNRVMTDVLIPLATRSMEEWRAANPRDDRDMTSDYITCCVNAYSSPVYARIHEMFMGNEIDDAIRRSLRQAFVSHCTMTNRRLVELRAFIPTENYPSLEGLEDYYDEEMAREYDEYMAESGEQPPQEIAEDPEIHRIWYDDDELGDW